jgi:hypothetical protein
MNSSDSPSAPKSRTTKVGVATEEAIATLGLGSGDPADGVPDTNFSCGRLNPGGSRVEKEATVANLVTAMMGGWWG